MLMVRSFSQDLRYNFFVRIALLETRFASVYQIEVMMIFPIDI